MCVFKLVFLWRWAVSDSSLKLKSHIPGHMKSIHLTPKIQPTDAECQAGRQCVPIFIVASMTQLGIEPTTSQSQGRHITPRPMSRLARFKIINISKFVTYFQTEDHQAKVPRSRNLKIWLTPNTRFKELCHLNPLKKTGTIYCLFWNHKKRFNI